VSAAAVGDAHPLTTLDASTLSHTALLSASRSLRQRALRRRIRGSASPAGLARVYASVSSSRASALSLDLRVHVETGHLRCARSGCMCTTTHCVGARSGSECNAPDVSSRPASPVIDEFRPKDAARLRAAVRCVTPDAQRCVAVWL
jgi:hypothetical protein